MNKIRKIAVPLVNQHLSDSFEQASTFIIFTIFRGAILKHKVIHTSNEQVVERIRLLKESGVSEILTHEAQLEILELLNRMKINVYIGVKGDDPEQLIQDYLQGKLLVNEHGNTE